MTPHGIVNSVKPWSWPAEAIVRVANGMTRRLLSTDRSNGHNIQKARKGMPFLALPCGFYSFSRNSNSVFDISR